MKKSNKCHKDSLAADARHGLRLVTCDSQEAQVETPPDEARPGLKSPLVNFMTAYADAIDRDIELLLKL